MDTRRIKKLIELVKETGIGELEVKSGEESVRITTHTGATTVMAPAPVATVAAPVAAPAAQPEAPSSVAAPAAAPVGGHEVSSPMVGTVYLAAEPGQPPFVAVGDRVAVGDTLCIIEAMKMFNKIEADRAGVLSARLVDNEQPVEYNQVLFVIDEDA
jgi:acetyl-CoA carboxylase biotin carboxyl carrier protein